MIQNKVWYSLIYLLERLDWNTFKFIAITLFERKFNDAHMLSKPIYTIVYRCTSFNVDFGQIYIYLNILIKQNETALVNNINSLSSDKKQYRCNLGPDKRLQHFTLVHITRKWMDWFQHEKYIYLSPITISISYW